MVTYFFDFGLCAIFARYCHIDQKVFAEVNRSSPYDFIVCSNVMNELNVQIWQRIMHDTFIDNWLTNFVNLNCTSVMHLINLSIGESNPFIFFSSCSNSWFLCWMIAYNNPLWGFHIVLHPQCPSSKYTTTLISNIRLVGHQSNRACSILYKDSYISSKWFVNYSNKQISILRFKKLSVQ